MSETFEQVSVSDIVERLKEPEIHYPGNFDTPKRANAVLSCLCQEAAEEIEELRREVEKWKATSRENKLIAEQMAEPYKRELAASQAREQQLREALEKLSLYVAYNGDDWVQLRAKEALALPQDTTALQAVVFEAGEVMRERAIKAGRSVNPIYGASVAIDAIHLLPQITIDDIK